MASKIVMPLTQMMFFTFLGSFATGPDNAHFYVIGNAVQIAAVSGIFGVTMSIGGERWSGTLVYLFGAPANRMMMFFGRAFMHIIDGSIGVVIAFLWGVTPIQTGSFTDQSACAGVDDLRDHPEHLRPGVIDGLPEPADSQRDVRQQHSLLFATDLLRCKRGHQHPAGLDASYLKRIAAYARDRICAGVDRRR